MTSVHIVIYGIRIPIDRLEEYLHGINKEIGNYEDWLLQDLVNQYKIPLVIVRRAYHDGDTSDFNEILDNCPLYIALATTDASTFDPSDLMKNAKPWSTKNLTNLLAEFKMPPQDLKLHLDTYDCDARTAEFEVMNSTCKI